jgi:hypothetical protein
MPSRFAGYSPKCLEAGFSEDHLEFIANSSRPFNLLSVTRWTRELSKEFLQSNGEEVIVF